MTEPVKTSLSGIFNIEKKKYLVGAQEHGGTAQGFRNCISSDYSRDPMKYNSRVLDLLMEAATRNWQARPRQRGPDLFSVNGETIPEHLTRPRLKYADGDAIEDDVEEAFEKVDSSYATVYDHLQDAQIKLRKAAQSSAAAERQFRQNDEMMRRAKGRMDVYIRDIADTAKEDRGESSHSSTASPA